MKTCTYCGRENPAEAIVCAECGQTEFADPVLSSPPSLPTPLKSPYEIAELPSGVAEEALVTLCHCDTLADADLIVSALEAAGIDAVIPDDVALRGLYWGLPPFGRIRVHVAASQYPTAIAILNSQIAES